MPTRLVTVGHTLHIRQGECPPPIPILIGCVCLRVVILTPVALHIRQVFPCLDSDIDRLCLSCAALQMPYSGGVSTPVALHIRQVFPCLDSDIDRLCLFCAALRMPYSGGVSTPVALHIRQVFPCLDSDIDRLCLFLRGVADAGCAAHSAGYLPASIPIYINRLCLSCAAFVVAECS
eukprot:COSAG01_NODE_2916_length_6860_cov_159.736430_6_plen_177_part_00